MALRTSLRVVVAVDEVERRYVG